MEKDNVLVEEQVKTEREETMSGMENAKDGKGSAVLKKFKDENALSQAYGALEAEFTRRSQRLKALEREFAKLQAEKFEKGGGKEEDSCSVESDARSKEEKPSVEPAYLTNYGDGTVEKESVGESEEKFSLDGAETFEKFAKTSANESVAQKVSDEEIYQRASKNEDIRLKIIGDYFESLKKSGAPLIRGGQGTIASPSVKATSVSQAGDMALRYFKAEKAQS